jgi:hypothetical protein
MTVGWAVGSVPAPPAYHVSAERKSAYGPGTTCFVVRCELHLKLGVTRLASLMMRHNVSNLLHVLRGAAWQ